MDPVFNAPLASLDSVSAGNSASKTADKSRTLIEMDIGCLHGSSSGSLVDVLRDGLIPSGMQQRVSFTGEKMGGILPNGLNSQSTSVVGVEGVELALSYADRNLTGWEPSRSQSIVARSEQWMRDGGVSEDIIRSWRIVREEVESARLARWQTLSQDEQLLISHPFPVVYGVSAQIPTGETTTSVRGELCVSSVPVDKLTIFVPPAQIEAATGLARRFGSSCVIASLALINQNEIATQQGAGI